MARIATTVESPWPPDQAFAFMADMRNFEQWDPGVKSVRQVEGDGPGPNAVFDVTVGGIGRDIVLRYRTLEYLAPQRVVLEASNSVLTSRDVITVEPRGEQSAVVYDADLFMNGMYRVGQPFLRLMFPRIVSRAAKGLRRRLAAEGS